MENRHFFLPPPLFFLYSPSVSSSSFFWWGKREIVCGGGGHGLKVQLKNGGERVKEGNDRIERRRKERDV